MKVTLEFIHFYIAISRLRLLNEKVLCVTIFYGGALSVTIIGVGIEIADTSSNL